MTTKPGQQRKSIDDLDVRGKLRRSVISQLEEDLDGGELNKEVWEACETEADREAVRDELRQLVAAVRARGDC